MIEIKEVASKKDLKLFATYPLILYKDCPYYVPSLRMDEMNTFDPKKNFSLKECDAKGFLAYKDGELVGRIAGIINHKYNELSGGKYIIFSRFECIDDIEVFNALLGAVENYGKQHGMKVIHGPWGFNDTDREGMLTYGFNERATYATNYYYPYFCENMKKLGFDDESKWVEYRFKIPDKPYDRIEKLAEKLKDKLCVKDVSETMSVKAIGKKYGDSLFETLNDAYGKLDGYVPIEDRMKDNVLGQFATICNPKYISVLVDKNEEVVAFGIVLPSICDTLIKHKGKLFPSGFVGVLKSIRNPTDLEMALIGVRSDYKNTGINSIILSKISKNVIDGGVNSIESNPMLETNYAIQAQWKFAESEIIKRRQTYKREIV